MNLKSKIIISFFSFLIISNSSWAATFTVNTTDDVYDNICDNAHCCLRDAIGSANDSPGTDTIEIPAGTYVLTIPDNLNSDLTSGDLDIEDSVNIQGAGAEQTIIDANSIDRVFDVGRYATGLTVSFSDLTIQGGLTTSGSIGAGILVRSQNQISLQNCIIKNNQAPNGQGGALYLEQGASSITNCTLTNNQAQYGAGIKVLDGTLTISQSLFDQNAGSLGGAITAGAVSMNITQSTFKNNSAGVGGAIHKSGGGVSIIDRSVFYANTASINGGALYFSAGSSQGTVAITNSTIANNVASSNAGGIEIASDGTDLVTLTNVTLAGNQSNGSGGGITNAGGNGNLIKMQNSIVKNSSGTGEPDCYGLVTSLGNNIINDLTGCTFSAGSGDLSNTDPLLDVFTDNLVAGNGHFPLLPTSPAANRANPDICTNQDQLGLSRIAVCDMGAIEATASCRDGSIQNNEECDDGNNIDSDGCLSNCRIATCGDGFIQAGTETCDDSNTTNLDGCSSICIIETSSTSSSSETDGSDTTTNNDGDTDSQTGDQNTGDNNNNAEGTSDNAASSNGSSGGGCSLNAGAYKHSVY